MSRAPQLGHVLDRYSYGALLQACTRHEDQAYGRARAREHVEALLRSEVPLNSFLSNMAKKALGARLYAQLMSAQDSSYS